ncbi:hypothetical protein BG006_007892 [Podila minutissima]|uniref:Uncharacterized protein n=1 Tax=Podila minutissima TaxID=64525 RepID=A0A9P5VKD0_9FUNG|nr:hypothetical protein BG006_007892 [Podila minutissima]
MHISIILAACVTLASASTPFVNTQSGSNGLVCPATTPFGTCAAQTTVPLTNPSINLHLTVVVIEEENEITGGEATVEEAPEAMSPEDVHTLTTGAPVFMSPEEQSLSHM